MLGKKNYTEQAKKHESAFRLILDKFQVPHKDLTVEQIYQKYSEGQRSGIWTILDFYEKEGNFVFASEDIAFMSGRGSEEVWKIEDGKAIHVKNEMVWMS